MSVEPTVPLSRATLLSLKEQEDLKQRTIAIDGIIQNIYKEVVRKARTNEVEKFYAWHAGFISEMYQPEIISRLRIVFPDSTVVSKRMSKDVDGKLAEVDKETVDPAKYSDYILVDWS